MGSRRSRRSGFSIINSIKNSVSNLTAGPDGTNTNVNVAIAISNPVSTNATDVLNGSKIFRVWVELWIYATQEIAVGVTNSFDAYFIKNPGNNLTLPTPGTQGTSNEKKFIFKTWKGMIGARTQGCLPYSWRGWIKIPKIYQRMGTDDRLNFFFVSNGTTSIVCTQFIYKWFT